MFFSVKVEAASGKPASLAFLVWLRCNTTVQVDASKTSQQVATEGDQRGWTTWNTLQLYWPHPGQWKSPPNSLLWSWRHSKHSRHWRHWSCPPHTVVALWCWGSDPSPPQFLQTTRPSTPSLAPWSWRHPWTLIPCKRLESRSILGPLALGNTNSRNCNLIFSTKSKCCCWLQVLHINPEGNTQKTIPLVSAVVMCYTYWNELPLYLPCWTCCPDVVMRMKLHFQFGISIGCIQGEHSFDGLELRYVTLGFDATLILHSWTTLQAFGRTSPFSVGSFFLAGLSDSVVIQQKENLQWCDSMIASILRVWCVESGILPNHNESHTLKSSSNPCCTVWHQRLVYTAIRYHLGVKTKTPKLDVPCSIIRRIWRSISSCFTFRVSRGLTDWIWHILLWHIGWQKHCVLLQGFIAYNQWFWFQSNPCHLSQPLHLTFQHPHVLSMFFFKQPLVSDTWPWRVH